GANVSRSWHLPRDADGRARGGLAFDVEVRDEDQLQQCRVDGVPSSHGHLARNVVDGDLYLARRIASSTHVLLGLLPCLPFEDDDLARGPQGFDVDLIRRRAGGLLCVVVDLLPGVDGESAIDDQTSEHEQHDDQRDEHRADGAALAARPANHDVLRSTSSGAELSPVNVAEPGSPMKPRPSNDTLQLTSTVMISPAANVPPSEACPHDTPGGVDDSTIACAAALAEPWSRCSDAARTAPRAIASPSAERS